MQSGTSIMSLAEVISTLLMVRAFDILMHKEYTRPRIRQTLQESKDD